LVRGAGAYGTEKLKFLWRTSAPHSKVGFLLTVQDHAVLSASNVFQGSNDSGIYVDGECVYRDNVETFDAATAWKGGVFVVSEHRDNLLRWDPALGFRPGTAMGMGGGYQGRWSIAAPFEWQGRLCFVSNDDYRGDKTFGDRARVRDCLDGKLLAEFPRKCLPIEVLVIDDVPYAAMGFGWEGVLGLNGRAFAGDYQRIAAFNSRYFAGGGVRFGRTNADRDRNGRVYVLDGGKFRTLFDTKGCGVQQFLTVGNTLYVTGSNPDTLWTVDRSLKVTLVAAFPKEARPDLRGGGCAIAFDPNGWRIFFARCDARNAFVYELMET
jgi:hypothetical protein